MKTIQVMAKFLFPQTVNDIQVYIEDIIAGETAMAEPLSDSNMTAQMNTLIIGACEAYFEHRHETGFEIVAFFCKNCRHTFVEVSLHSSARKSEDVLNELIARHPQCVSCAVFIRI
jgi:hypothetical protein